MEENENENEYKDGLGVPAWICFWLVCLYITYFNFAVPKEWKDEVFFACGIAAIPLFFTYKVLRSHAATFKPLLWPFLAVEFPFRAAFALMVKIVDHDNNRQLY